MTELEKAYITGIVDGEGIIMLQKFHHNEYPSTCISITSTTSELLDWIKSVIGKGTIKLKKNYNNSKHKDFYDEFISIK